MVFLSKEELSRLMKKIEEKGEDGAYLKVGVFEDGAIYDAQVYRFYALVGDEVVIDKL